MQDVWMDAVVILGACFVVVAVALAVILFRPVARRRRRHRRHTRRPKIDLLRHEPGDSALSGDA